MTQETQHTKLNFIKKTRRQSSRKLREKFCKYHQILEHFLDINLNSNSERVVPEQPLNAIVSLIDLIVLIMNIGALSAVVDDVLHITNGMSQ